jgi:hypothetical protein
MHTLNNINGRNANIKIEEIISANPEFSSKGSNFETGEIFNEQKLLASPLRNLKRKNEKVCFTTNQLSPSQTGKTSAPEKAMLNKYKHLFSDVNNISAISSKVNAETSMNTDIRHPYMDLGYASINTSNNANRSEAVSFNYKKVFTVQGPNIS